MVELPPADAEHEFYSIYFSRGVRLEADLIGQQLLAQVRDDAPSSAVAAVKQVRQVYRQGDIGEAAVRCRALEHEGIELRPFTPFRFMLATAIYAEEV